MEKMKFKFEMAKAYSADKKRLGWAWRCACGKCSSNWAGPYKTLREAKRASHDWADQIAEAAESTHH